MSLLGGFVLLLLLAAPALAEELVAVPDTKSEVAPTLLAQLGQPARAEAVQEALTSALEGEVADAYELAVTLGYAGGLEAARGLLRLSQHRGEHVRIAALRACNRIGIRLPRLVDAARAATQSRSQEERIAALETLATLGDGADAPLLLSLIHDADPTVQVTAYRALQSLSGRSIPCSSARWEYWWRKAQRQTAVVDRVLRHLMDEPQRAANAAELRTLREFGWLRLNAIGNLARAWLDSSEPRLRVDACELIAQHRLGALAAATEWVCRLGHSPEVVEAARSTLCTLGVHLDESQRAP